MKLIIKQVKDHGTIKNERIILQAIDNVDVGYYMIADTTYINKDEVSNKLRHTFWMPDKIIKKDDLIVIYTKNGKDSINNNKSGTQTHFFYWGLEKTIWNIEEDAAAIFSINDWVSKKV